MTTPTYVSSPRYILQKEGYDVTCVDDGAGAVAKIVQTQPSLVVLDLMLPGMSGYDVCKEVRQLATSRSSC